MKSDSTITASARRVVRRALEIALEEGHRRDLDGDEIMEKAYDTTFGGMRFRTPTGPFFCAAPPVDETEAAIRHLGILVNIIHHKDSLEIARIVALCLTVEVSQQLRCVGHRQAASAVSTLMSAPALG